MFFCGSVLVFFRQTNTRLEKIDFISQKNFYVFLWIRVSFFQTNEHASRKKSILFAKNFDFFPKNLIFLLKIFYVFLRIRVSFFQTNEHASQKPFF
jgi:hypothetical protein